MHRFFEILIALGQNMAVVLALLLVLSWVHNRCPGLRPRTHQVLFGTLFGLAACWGMLSPVELSPGVIVDSRAVLVSLAALFGGVLAGSVAALPVCALRLALGGVGTAGGIFSVLAALFFGGVLARYLTRRGQQVGYRHLLLLGISTSCVSLGSIFLLPGPLAFPMFESVSISVGIIYSLGTLVLGALVMIENERRIAERSRLQSDQRFRRATDASQIGVWEWDVKTGEITHSDNAALLFGLSRRSLPTHYERFFALPDPEDALKLRNLMRETIEHGSRCHAEYRCTWPDGTVHWHAIRGLVEHDGDGVATGMVGIIADISERRAAQAALEKSELRLMEAQEISKTGSFEVRFDEDVLYWSDELYRMMELDPAAFTPTQHNYLQFTHPDDRAGYREAIRDALRERAPLSFGFRANLASGEEKFLHTHASPNYDDDGNVNGLQGTVQDVTDRVQAERQLRDSEARYRSVVESLPFCLHEIDPEGQMISMNASGLAMLNAKDESEVQGVHYLELVAEKDRERVARGLAKALGGAYVPFEFEPAGPASGQTFSSSFMPVRDSVGKVVRIVGHSIDITEERRRQDELRDLAAAIEQAAESIMITDTAGTIQYVNPSYEAITGFTREEAIGTPAAIVRSGEQGAGFYESLWESLAIGKTWNGEYVSRHKDGSTINLRATISPVFEEGRIVKYVGVQRDITHELALERQLIQAQKMEAVGTLAGGIAHDFNNILQSILGYCHIARESEGGAHPETASCIREIEGGANRAGHLVGQILTFSRATDAAFRPISLPAITRDALVFMRGSLPASIDIRQDIEVESAWVLGDDTQLHQVLTNLCTNAYQAMEEHGGMLTVGLARERVDVERSARSGALTPGSYIRLSVADTGTGIEAIHLARIFDPFFTTKKVGKGTGLGLSSVHGIVTRMGGIIDIDSTPNVGTVFQVYLPECDAPRTSNMPASVAKESVPGKGRVMLVDDETAITTAARVVLTKQGFDVEVHNDALEALHALESDGESINLLVCDYTMPKLNGLELARKVRAFRPELPIIMATGVIESDDMEKALAEGIREILKKPFRMEVLVDVVRQHLHPEMAAQEK